MKRIFTIIAFFCVSFCLAQEIDLPVKSTIEHVTVFLEGAQIGRQATVSLNSGVSILTFSGVSRAIQEQSIQVETPSAVKILAVSFKVDYLDEVKPTGKVSALEDERKQLLANLSQEKALAEVYREEEEILKTNKSIGGTTEGVSIEELKIAMDYFRQRLLDIKQQQLQIERNIKKYGESIGKVESQLRELSAVKTRPTGEIRVKVSSKSSLKADVKLNYVVNEARWFPSYDIRAKDIKSPILVAYKANVSQHSGEDWENVSLTISSGNPTHGGAKPIIKPWILGFNNSVTSSRAYSIGTVQEDKKYGSANNFIHGRIVDDEGEGMPGINVLVKGTTIGTVTDAIGYYSIPLTPDAQTLVVSFVGYKTQEVEIQGKREVDIQMTPDVAVLSEVVVTGYGNQSNTIELLEGRAAGVTSYGPRVKKTIVATPVVRQTHVEYTLDEPFTVRSDGEVRTTDMVEYQLDALYEYYCVPKLDTDAFLIAKILQWDDHNFLEGEANLFFEGKYIGKSVIDTRNTSDTLSLSLGRDGNVVVVREKKKDFTSRHVIGSNQKLSVGYTISVRNKKSEPLAIVIEDQIPIPNDKEISVDKIESSDAEYDDATGLLRWKKTIDPGKTEVIDLKYAVRFPKNSRMILE